MGPNDENNYVMTTLDGQPVEFADFPAVTTTELEEPEIEANAERGRNLVEGFIDGLKHPVDWRFPNLPVGRMGRQRMTVTMQKRLRCTTRKRYVKLRMSEGVCRNKAEMEALFLVNWLGVDYQTGYFLINLIGDSVCFCCFC